MVYSRVCQKCGEVFTATTKYSKVCPECSKAPMYARKNTGVSRTKVRFKK